MSDKPMFAPVRPEWLNRSVQPTWMAVAEDNPESNPSSLARRNKQDAERSKQDAERAKQASAAIHSSNQFRPPSYASDPDFERGSAQEAMEALAFHKSRRREESREEFARLLNRQADELESAPPPSWAECFQKGLLIAAGGLAIASTFKDEILRIHPGAKLGLALGCVQLTAEFGRAALLAERQAEIRSLRQRALKTLSS